MKRLVLPEIRLILRKISKNDRLRREKSLPKPRETLKLREVAVTARADSSVSINVHLVLISSTLVDRLVVLAAKVSPPPLYPLVKSLDCFQERTLGSFFQSHS